MPVRLSSYSPSYSVPAGDMVRPVITASTMHMMMTRATVQAKVRIKALAAASSSGVLSGFFRSRKPREMMFMPLAVLMPSAILFRSFIFNEILLWQMAKVLLV